MKRLPNAIYQTAAEIEERIRQREFEVMRLAPDSAEHRNIMKEIAQLRVYADAKRLFAGPTKQEA